MRKKALLFVCIPLLLACAAVYLFIDGWVEAGIEAGGEAVVGARVEIDRLHVTLFPIGIRWERMQVADPRDTWKNLFETGRVTFAMDAGQLLRGKYIVETMEVSDLVPATPRTTDGALPGGRGRAAESSSPGFTDLARRALEQTIEPTPIFNLENIRRGFNPDSLVRSLDLQTLRQIDTLRARATSASLQWRNTLADVESSRVRLVATEARIRAIDPASLRSVESIVSAIGTVDQAITTIGQVRTTFEARKTSVLADARGVLGSVGAVDEAVREDYRKLLSMARLPDLNTDGIARILVGKEMEQRARTYLGWVDFARSTIRRYTPEPDYEKPPRFRGQDIAFPVERHYPKFWIMKARVSGGSRTNSGGVDLRLSGEVRDIASDQTVTGRPMTVELRGEEGGGRSLSLRALFDRRSESPLDEYHVTLEGVPLAEFRVGRSDFLPTRIAGARMRATVDVTVPGSRFDARSSIALSGFTVTFDSTARNLVERLLRDVLQGIRGFDAGLRLWNTSGPFQLALQTDLDDQVAARLKQVLGAELLRLQNDLRSRLDAVISRKRAEAEQFLAAKRAELEQTLSTYDGIIRQQTELLDSKKKELTDRLEKEKKGALDDLLKKVIK